MWQYIILGIIQGIVEWIPISSEGVVAFFSQTFLDGGNPVDIAIFLHLGTFFAVMIYFVKDWIRVLTFKDPTLFRFLLIATIASLAVGYPLYLLVRNTATGAVLLFVMGVGLLITSYFHRNRRFKFNMDESSRLFPVIAGVFQGLAVIPGLSRSGATIFGLSLGKIGPSRILRLSYMMSAPAILASSAYLMLDSPNLLLEGWPALLSSFITGIATLAFLMKIVERINFFWFTLIFAILCFIGGILIFLV